MTQALRPLAAELRDLITHPVRYHRRLGRNAAREWRRWRHGFADRRELERMLRRG